jgi:exodeoxyribonuclease V alpha subunit
MNMDAKITSIRYKSEPQKGAVFYIAETDKGIIKGKSHLELEINQNFQIEGEWQISKYNGQREFLFRSIIPSLPVTPRARFEYACSITKGIGDCLQEKIWEAVGESWDDSDLSGIPGIGRETKAAWQTTLIQIKNQKEQADIFAWMMQVGLTPNMAAAAWNEWNKDCGGIIQQNPYRLTELPNYGFKAIDGMVINSKEWDIGMLDPRRVKAAILYLLDENAGAGHTAVDLRRFKRLAMDICKGINSDMLQEAMKDNSVVLLNMEYGEDAASVARRKDYDNETRIWRRWTCN